MPSLNVYLAPALKAEMESVEGVNWSQIAQDAIRAELARKQVMNAAQVEISQVAARLKSTASTYTSGYSAGVDWARAVATAEQLEVLESWDWEAELEQAESSGGELFAADVVQALFVQEWGYSSAAGIMGGRITERRLEGFIDGAMSVWKEAKQLM